jgi:hypothetical protein
MLGILLMPLQVFSLFLAASRFDLSPFILLLFAGAFALRNGIRMRSLVVLAAFVALHVALLAVLGVAPSPRVVSGVVWLGGLLFWLLDGSRVRYRQDLACKAILAVMSLTAIYVLYQSFILHTDRPKGWFHEPSFAGLCLFATAAGVLVTLLLVRDTLVTQVRLFGCFVLLFAAALMTLSMHFVTFMVTVSGLAIFLWGPRLFRVRFRNFGFRTFALAAVFAGVLAFVAMQLLTMQHFLVRLNFANPTNFSLLSWLRGLDQMRAAIAASPIVGLGLGSTGYFPFQSTYSTILEQMGRPNLNITDAYSLLFRLVIEIGLPLVLIFLGYLALRLRAFVAWTRSSELPAPERAAIVFNFVWALAVIAGCLLKEPLYSQSFLYVATLLIASVPLTAPQVAPDRGRGASVPRRVDGGGLQPEFAPSPQ